MLNAARRQRMAAFMRENEHHILQWMLGSVFVITSPFVRLALSAVFYIKPMPTPYVVTPSLPVAVDWASRRFADAGLSAQAKRIRNHHGLSAISEAHCS
jgi:hypothetical protein